MIKTFLEKKYEKKPAQNQNMRATDTSMIKAEQGAQIILDAIVQLMSNTEQNSAHQQANVLLKKSLRDVQRAVAYLKNAKAEELAEELRKARKK